MKEKTEFSEVDAHELAERRRREKDAEKYLDFMLIFIGGVVMGLGIGAYAASLQLIRLFLNVG